jgi:2-dehydro-3-deoxyphosphogalactonate aldolase
MDRLTPWLSRCPLVAILRGVTPEEIPAVGQALVDAGIVIIEIPLNSPRPIESIERLADTYGSRALLGAGTVMRAPHVSEVAAAGGRLIVTPHAQADVVRAAKAHDLIAIPGFFTVTEAFTLLDAGADALKLFPAEAASPAALGAMRAVLPPDTIVLPMGGIDARSFAPWIKAGAKGFGVGSAIYRPGDSAATVADKAKALVAAMIQAKQKQ